MRNVVDACVRLGYEKLSVRASNGGSYLSARCGFLPDQVPWDTIRPEMLNRLASPEFHHEPTHWTIAVREALNSPLPEGIWMIAKAATPEFVDPDSGRKVSLGRKLLAYPNTSWSGKLDLLPDSDGRRRFDAYVREQEESRWSKM